MRFSLIKRSDRKPHPASIGYKSLSICIALGKTPKGVPALVTVTCRDIQVYDFEYVAVIEAGSVASIGVGLVWREFFLL